MRRRVRSAWKRLAAIALTAAVTLCSAAVSYADGKSSVILAAFFSTPTPSSSGSATATLPPSNTPPIETPTPTTDSSLTPTTADPSETPTHTPIETLTATPEGLGEETATPEETADMIITIHAPDASIEQGDMEFSLSSHASAVDENDMPIPVFVASDGNFNIEIPGVYMVTYVAIHPVTLEEFSASCIVEVLEKEEKNTSTLQGTSDGRYRKYQQYRDAVSHELTRHMERLNGEFDDQMRLLRMAFPQTAQYQLLRQTYMETEDDMGGTGFEAAVQMTELEEAALSNWGQVLAVFIAKSSLTVENPLDLFNLRKISFDTIDRVFWDMHEFRFEMLDGRIEMILIEHTSDEMADRYEFSPERRAQLDELMQPEFQRLFAALTGDDSFVDLTEEEISAIRASLPAGMDMQRENIVMTAHTLVGQVRYFWGGKYYGVGWNPLWGVPKVVTSLNSPTTGTVRPFGLDCSGFVTWVFINAVNDPNIAAAIGSGSANQWSRSRSLGWDEAQPGDLAFRAVPGSTAVNHVGIVVEVKEDGTIMVAHCSSSRNNVVITEAWSSGFRYMRRPVLYDNSAQ